MKLLALSLFAATLGGIGVHGLGPGEVAADAPPACEEDCTITVERTPRGTCLVVCRDADGAEVCRREVECDEECERSCDAPSSCEPAPASCKPAACSAR